MSLNDIYRKQYEQSLQNNKKNKKKRKLEAIEHIDSVLKRYEKNINTLFKNSIQQYEINYVKWKHSNPNYNPNKANTHICGQQPPPIKPTFKSISNQARVPYMSVGLLQSIRDCLE